MLLGAFGKLRKATFTFVISVRLSVRPHRITLLPLGGFSRNFMPEFFENMSRIFKFPSNLTWITDTSHEDAFSFMTLSRWIILRRRAFSVKVVEKIKTHFLCSTTFFSRKSCRLEDNVEKYCGATHDSARYMLGKQGYTRVHTHGSM